MTPITKTGNPAITLTKLEIQEFVESGKSALFFFDKKQEISSLIDPKTKLQLGCTCRCLRESWFSSPADKREGKENTEQTYLDC